MAMSVMSLSVVSFSRISFFSMNGSRTVMLMAKIMTMVITEILMILLRIFQLLNAFSFM